MYDLALFAALGWERRAVLAALAGVRPMAPRTWQGRLDDGATCLVVQTGIGPERAARAAAAAPPARALVSCGCAGALAEHLRPGDVVIGDGVIELDAGGAAGERLPAASAAIVARARARRLPVHAGAVAASPVVLTSAAAKRAAAASGALAVDMESGAIARAARARGVPALVVRVVLDTVGDAVPLGPGAIDAESGELRPVRALASVLPPWRWGLAARLARRSRIADRRLRECLALLLGADGIAVLDVRP